MRCWKSRIDAEIPKQPEMRPYEVLLQVPLRRMLESVFDAWK
jgi:hypothetical protein